MSIALETAVDPSPVPLEPEAPFLRVEDRNGVIHELAAVEGWRLMEILRDYGIGMENTCGGALACAECHVVLDAGSAARVPPPQEDELEKLDELPMLYENSRLACQIIWSDEMSGLSLKLAQET
ncbi:MULTISPECIES: 2Fe-2S iron-sulfur cluster-binding protein [Methylocystis]|uniref:2Fe-2S iron-sulfur cluster-binding protein n=1 Tax=Methylocystis TaxID=133 RepID=UPI001924D5C5|nr:MULTISPECIES: 2Fe-2S iron-sulfur cluster-binding protein [Methylocystis]MBL1258585.1 2Fe-2S iron-sulfur cluster binding domain-containing protein [Methylocystis sp. Sn-Cys]MDJ0449388.1 2Fe-2S iron-sulfur cluster-binding protein [Methylocystis sp. JR02]